MVKGKRWKKGQSSSSNPTCKKYRDITKNSRAFFSFGLPAAAEGSGAASKSQLTAKALAELDARSSAGGPALINDDSRSMISDADSADTFRSWASNWSDCTNATFNRVHRYWKSNSALHKEILAVLAAVTEVIKENDGKETETEYFAALMTGLESVKDNEDSAAAFVYLIALAIKKVPETVLRAKFADLLASFDSLLAKYGEKATNVTLIKSCLMCLCWLLKSQEASAWRSQATQRVYFAIMKFVVHSKPKIRKCGQEAVRLILNSCVSATTNTELSVLTADHCMRLIVDEGSAASSAKKDRESATSSDKILYTLTLLKHIVHHFVPASLKDVGECLLQLIALKEILITSACFQVFHALFEAQTNHLSADLTGQMINAFYDYQPSENDPQQLIAWLAVVEAAVRCLNRLNRPNCLPHLPHFFQVAMLTLSGSHHASVHAMAAHCMRSVLEQCVQTNMDLLAAELQQATDVKRCVVAKVFAHIEAGMSYQYHAAWPFVMKILACAFTSLRSKDTFSIVQRALGSLANLRESEQFTFKKEADEAIGRAVQTYGPRLMLECIPLEITGDETTFDYPRSWMLPLLAAYTEKTELGYFARTLMPLAKKLKLRAEQLGKAGRPLEAKILDTLHGQVWALLPGFCDFATDLNESFPSVAKLLGEVLEKQPELRPTVLHAIRTAILRSTDEGRAVIRRFAKNYLPIMFNIYTTEVKVDKDPARQSILDTIKCYLKVTEPALRNTYLKQALVNYDKYAKLDEQESVPEEAAAPAATAKGSKPKVVFDFDKMDAPARSAKPESPAKALYRFARYSFLDLIGVLVAYADEDNTALVYALATSAITSKTLDKTVQKKCYKILDALLVCGRAAPSTAVKDEFNIHKLARNDAVAGFVEQKFAAIADTLVRALSQCNAAAKVPRLRCLLGLLGYVQSVEQRTLVRQTLPEVILCVKEVNQKSRDAAFQLLAEMARLWQRLSGAGASEIDALDEFLRLVMVGLAGSKNLAACTCLALSALAFEFKEHLSGPMIGELVETACLLVRSEAESRDLLMGSLSLLKVLCSIFAQATLGQHLKPVCAAVLSLHEKRGAGEATAAPVSKSQRVRAMVKVILKKLMKKFGFELVYESLLGGGEESTTSAKIGASVRASLENLLTNLKKLIEKERQRKLDEAKKGGAGDDDKPVDLVSMYTSKSRGGAHPANEVEELLRESSSEDEEMDDRATARTAKSQKRGAGAKKQSKSAGGGMDAWLQENENDDPLDLLDPMAMKRVLATKPLTKEQIERKKAKQADKSRGFKTSADGRLLIDDDSDDDDSADDRKSTRKGKGKKKGGGDGDEIDEMMDTLSLSKKSLKSNKSAAKKKRQMDSDDDSDDEDVDERKSTRPSYKAGGTGIHRPAAKKTVEFGSEYRSKKSSGDVKIKNKPDPYAYIPFNYGKLNKRKRAKLEGEFKGVVKAVKRAGAGAKATRGRGNAGRR